MKSYKNKLLLFLLISFTLPHLAVAQDGVSFNLSCGVHKVYPYISITKEKLQEAKTLADLNARYQPSWVRTYISVEVLCSHNGEIMSATSSTDILSLEQKATMNMADAGSDITVKVQYIPENTLKRTEIQMLDFTVSVDPETDAQYPGGQQALDQYLKENVLDKIPGDLFKRFNLSAVKFAVNETGKVTGAYVFESSKEESTDALLLQAIRNMPNWTPAAYAGNIPAKQAFVFTIGDMDSCVVPLLGIHQN